MADLVWVSWYATVLRQDAFAAEVAAVAPLVLRYGATQYQVHINTDDRYRITQMSWFENKTDWYRYWDGPEMIEFRARNAGRFQIPITYAWQDELVAGTLDPEMATLRPEPVGGGPGAGNSGPINGGNGPGNGGGNGNPAEPGPTRRYV